MTYFASCFLVGIFATLLIMRSSMRHGHLSADHDLRGVQKFHARPVPRIGGAGVMTAIMAGAIVAQFNHSPVAEPMWLLIVCALPAFVTGIAEDLTKKVTPRWRLLATTISAALAAWLLDGLISRTSIPGVDTLVRYFPISLALTLLVIAGVANAVNIIDGFNGLASMCVFMMTLAMAYVSFQVGDTFIFTAALITAGAVLGFFVWNFPAGLIFLGDGGAYLLGFLLAELGILLVQRNAAVSPMFPLLLCAYPIFETIFTIYRRKFVRGVATAAPDGIHLHTLIHRRLIRWTLAGQGERRLTRRNSATSPYLWMLCLTSVIPSVLWWYSTAVLSCFLLLFVVTYMWLYARIVRFKTPRWLIFRKTSY